MQQKHLLCKVFQDVRTKCSSFQQTELGLQAQRDTAQEALKTHGTEAKAAAASVQSAHVRVHHMEKQLAARVDELDNLQLEYNMMATEAEEWRAKGVALSVQLEASVRAVDASKARAKVLTSQVQQRQDEMANLKHQLTTLNDHRCVSQVWRPSSNESHSPCAEQRAAQLARAVSTTFCLCTAACSPITHRVHAQG
jgi:chromosome segregation ATPase